MKKFFLKHKNIIMALVSVLLMLSFSMLGSKPTTPEERLSAAAGYLNGKKVTVDQIAGARRELQLLQQFEFLPAGANGRNEIENLWARQGGQDDQVGLYWYLLCQDAMRYVNVQVPLEQAIADATRMGFTDQDVRNAITDSSGLFASAVSHFYSVRQYLAFLGNFGKPISALELAADRELRRLQVQYVPIDAASGWEGVPEDQVKDKLAAQFAAYKDIQATHEPAGPGDPPVFLGVETDEKGPYALIGYPGRLQTPEHVRSGETVAWDGSKVAQLYRPGEVEPTAVLVLTGGGRTLPTLVAAGADIHGNPPPAPPAEIDGHHFAFGYKFPDRVKVEYLKFSWKALRGRLNVTAADVDAAMKEFHDDPYEFRSDPDATADATKPHRTVDQIMADWDDPAVRRPYLDRQLDLRTDRMLAALVSVARSKADAPWLTAKETVEPSAWVSYAAVAQTVAHDPSLTSERGSALKRWLHGASIGDYVPEQDTTGPAFLSALQLQNVPGIGHALFTKAMGQTQNLGMLFDFPMLATHIKPLVTLDRSTPLGQLNLELGQQCPEVTDRDKNVYLFRVTACEQSHVPASLDEVRGQVLADCRQRAAYERTLEAVAKALQTTPDLPALAATYHSAVQTPPPFNHQEETAPVDVRNIPDFVKTAFAMPDPKETNKPSTTMLPNDPTLHAYAIRLLTVTPASGEEFIAGLNQGYFSNESDPAVGQFALRYLDIEEIAKRLKFTLPPGTSWPRKTPATGAAS